MEVLVGDRNITEAEAEQEFPAQITSSSEIHQVVFANPTAAATTPRKLRIRCNGRSIAPALQDDADPGQLGSGAAGDNGLSLHNGDDHFKEQGVRFVSWKGKRKRTSFCSNAAKKRKRLEKMEHFVESLVNKMMEKQEQMLKQLIETVQDREKERIAEEEAWKQRELERIARDEEVRAQETSRCLAVINFVQNLLGGDVQVPRPASLVAKQVSTVVPPSSNDHRCVGGVFQVRQPSSLVARQVATVLPPNSIHDHRCVGGVVQVPQPVATLVPPSSGRDHQCVEGHNNLHKDTEIVECSATPTNRRWGQAEVQVLVELWASLKHKFCSSPPTIGHKLIWEEISLGMNRMGYDRTASKCKEKWVNMTKYFRRAITSDKQRPENGRTCQYFNQLGLLCKSLEENNLHKDNEIVKCSATPTGKGWQQAEVRALIALRASLEDKFCAPTDSTHSILWEEISLGMKRMGYDSTGRSCREKWDNMTKYFTSDGKLPVNTNTGQYLKQLMVLCENGLLSLENDSSPTSNLGNGFSCTSNQKETKNDNELPQCVLSSVETAAIPSVGNSNEAADRARVVVSPTL